MLNANEGQTYVCMKSDTPWWTTGKEYNVVVNKYGEMYFVDDYGGQWTIDYLNNRTNYQFKLKDMHEKEETTWNTRH
ncbi:hypothetical protein EFP01_178 [Enterococcus phage EFP01]|uniref:Uncharacterized protein n=1 Tax=Enterococcus phage EFP01 TaxID=1926594 RepID=A0A288TZT4_9CAUD|nr:hypothetical protein HOR47_gp178 [Enterococcus phage EFP01]APZ82105.1 hypothetical protein EFP01_178 [Enterococcus phage EFP01]